MRRASCSSSHSVDWLEIGSTSASSGSCPLRLRGRIAAGERVQIGERQAAPGRAQHREPGEAVAAMRERARQREQVLHHRAGRRAGRSRSRGSARPAALQLRHDLAQVAALAHQDRDARWRSARLARGARCRATISATASPPRSPAPPAKKRMHCDRRALAGAHAPAPTRCRRTAPAAMSSRSRHHLRERARSPSRRCRPASGNWPTAPAARARRCRCPRRARAGTVRPRLRGSGRSTASGRRPRTACGRRPGSQPAVSRATSSNWLIEVSWNSSTSRCRIW